MNTEELNALKDRAHKTAVEHGFYEDIQSDAYYLGIVMSDMGKAIDADRNGRHANTEGFTDFMESEKFYFRLAFDSYIKGSVEEKLADIVIRLLDFAMFKEYTLHVEAKASYSLNSNDALLKFEESGLPSMLFYLMDILTAAYGWNELQTGVYELIRILSDCFKNITGSDRDLWWFVERKIGYNEVKPKFDGEIY